MINKWSKLLYFFIDEEYKDSSNLYNFLLDIIEPANEDYARKNRFSF